MENAEPPSEKQGFLLDHAKLEPNLQSNQIQTARGILMVQPSPGKWSTTLCECCTDPGGVGLCAMSLFCSCFVQGKNAEALSGPGAPFFVGFWGGFVAALIPVLNCFCAYAHATETLKVRDSGSNLTNGCQLGVESFLCWVCVICRTRREQILSLGQSEGYIPEIDPAAEAMLCDSKAPVRYDTIPPEHGKKHDTTGPHAV